MDSISGSGSDFPLWSFFAGLLDVNEETAGPAFCAALVESVVSNKLTKEEIDVFSEPRSERGFEILGTFLGKLIEANERLQGQQVEGPSPVIPAPAS